MKYSSLHCSGFCVLLKWCFKKMSLRKISGFISMNVYNWRQSFGWCWKCHWPNMVSYLGKKEMRGSFRKLSVQWFMLNYIYWDSNFCITHPLHFLHTPWKMASISSGCFTQWKYNGPPIEWNVIPLQTQLASILNVGFFGVLSLKLTVNLLFDSVILNSNRNPICSEFQLPVTSQLLPSGVLLHCFDSLIISSSSRIWSNIIITLLGSSDLLFVTESLLAAGPSANVLFVNIFDKSLSNLLLIVVPELCAYKHVSLFVCRHKNRTINFRDEEREGRREMEGQVIKI